MGQQQSADIGDRPNLRHGGRRGKSRRNLKNRLSSFRGNSKFNIHGDDDEYLLEDKIKLYKKELEKLAAHGVTKQREHQMELSKLDNDLYRKRVELHRLGERAKTFYTFWDYVKIVQRATPTVWSPHTMSFIESESDASESSHATDDLTPVPPSPSSSSTHGRSPKRSKSPKLRRKSKSPRSHRKRLGTPKGSARKGKRPISGKEEKKLMLQRSSTDMTFTIFGFFEAYLLRRLHLALLLKNQSTMQRHRWNDIIVYCYDEIPATKRDTQQAKDWLEYLKGVTPTYQKKLEKTLEHLLSIQDKIMYELRSQEERRKGLEEQAALQNIENAIDDDDYTGSLPTITQTDSGEINFMAEEEETKPSSFSYHINTEVAATAARAPEAPIDPKPADGRIYDASEFNTGTKGAAMNRSSHHRPMKKSDHNRVFERQNSRGSSDDWSSDDGFVVSDDDDFENPKLQMVKKEETVVKKEEDVAKKEEDVTSTKNGREGRNSRRGSKWKMPWRGQASGPDSGNPSGDADADDLKMSAEYSAVGNEYGRLSMMDDDDEDEDRYDYIAQEAKRQPVASSALAGGASMMMLQKSVRAQQQESKPGDSQEHFQLSTTGSNDDS